MGLSSEDDDYVQPAYLRSYPEEITAAEEEEARSANGLPSAVTPGDCALDSASTFLSSQLASLPTSPVSTPARDRPDEAVPDVSSSSGSGSDQGDETLYIPPPPTNGQTFIDHDFRIPFDQLFLTMFSESQLLKVRTL